MILGGVQMLIFTEGQRHMVADGGVHHVQHGLLDVQTVQHLTALGVDDLALLVHDVIVFQNGLTGLEVAALHGGLGVFDGTGQHLVFDGGILVQIEFLHHVLDAVAAEQTHEVIFQRDIEPGLAGVALTAGTATELIVDPAGFVALGADDEQAAGRTDLFSLFLDDGFVIGHPLGEQLPGGQNIFIVGVSVAGGVHDDLLRVTGLHQIGPGEVLGVAAQHDIRTTAGHVGGHGDGAQLTGLSHDLGFLLVVFGVQQIVLNAFPLEQVAQQLVLLDGHGAHQNGLALLMALLHLLDDRTELARLGLIHNVMVVLTLVGTVGWDLHNVQIVDGAELLCLGHGGTGHTGELIVQAEVVLEGDGSQGLVFTVDVDVLLGFDGLMETVGVPAAEHETAGELVHDDDLAVLHHVVNIPLHGAVGLQRLIDVVVQRGVGGIGQVLHMEEFLRLGNAGSGEGGCLGLFVHDIVGIDVGVLFLLIVHLHNYLFLQAGDEHLRHIVHLGGLFALTGNNQGGTGLIDQDGVHLVHDGEAVAPLHQLTGVDAHIVAEVVEAHLVVGAVGDVGGVGVLALLSGEAVDDEAYLQTQEAVDLAHPLGVTLGQIVIDGDNMDTFARQRVQIGGKGGYQGLAFTGLHLGDPALMQHDAAHQLHPVGTHAQHTVRGLPHGGKSLRQNVIQGLAVGKTLLELRGLGLKLCIGEGLVFIAQRLDLIHNGVDGFQLPGAIIAKDRFQKSHRLKNILSRFRPALGGKRIYHIK